ncbi:hypothetical protein SARC_07869 [Sphaeroforma arctica JP610]|uniref:Uncharacterized protein n=1 Tax=Sphaeroforma arctica JP610 TaxID=667725 RepID=A0A0L0FSG5_9EUKA|nr:hypothetical protein SARC_07869 [Sphaeroforma arctica JP610]KNC79742.1 hypothetical protein SARC_07869 [Sphaeroforma arctica JP610]|eukprot:XP_014153644.1 hypothetical protein SARC_07869 [Sphaeroforma arctica JP610]
MTVSRLRTFLDPSQYVGTMKGLEYRNVVPYNVFKANPLGKSIRVLYNYNTEAAGNTKFTAFDDVKHFALCQMLKELYVGITRAKEKVVCVDDRDACDDDEPQIYADVFSDMLISSESKNEVEFTRSSTREEWALRTKALQNQKMFEEAAIAYARGSHPEKVAEMKALLARRAYKDGGDTSKLIEAAEFYEEAGMAGQGADLLRDNKFYEEAAAMYEKLEGRGKETVTCYWQSHQPLKVYTALEKNRHAYEKVADLDNMYIELAPVLFQKDEPDLGLKCITRISDTDSNIDRVCPILEAAVAEESTKAENATSQGTKGKKGKKGKKSTALRTELRKKLKMRKYFKDTENLLSDTMREVGVMVRAILPRHGAAIDYITNTWCNPVEIALSYVDPKEAIGIESRPLMHLMSTLLLYAVVVMCLKITRNGNSKLGAKELIPAFIQRTNSVILWADLFHKHTCASRLAVFNKASVAILLHAAMAENKQYGFATQACYFVSVHLFENGFDCEKEGLHVPPHPWICYL